MIKIFNRYLPLRVFIFIGIDAACLFLVTSICLFAAAGWETIRSGNGILLIAGIGILCITTMYFFDLYDFDRVQNRNDIIIATMRAVGVGAIVLAPISLFFLRFGIHARHLEIGLLSAIVLVCLYRISYDYLASHTARGERILLLGRSPIISLLEQKIREKSYLPLQMATVMTALTNGDDADDFDRDCSKLDGLILSFRPKRIAVDISSKGYTNFAARLVELRQRGIQIDDAHALYEAMSARVPVSTLQTPNFAHGPRLSINSWHSALHYTFDFIVASIIFLLTWPIFLVVAMCIRIDSKGPIFYKQERVGLHGNCFNVIKFRSMRSDAEATSGPVWAQEKDNRITRCGSILRKLRLDELPQIWNVLRGDMSLVGPRPERPHFVEMLKKEIPFYDLRHSIRPGITGWAQVCAPYGASIAESQEKVEYDLFYLKNKSMVFDTFILFRTAKVCLLGRGSR